MQKGNGLNFSMLFTTIFTVISIFCCLLSIKKFLRCKEKLTIMLIINIICANDILWCIITLITVYSKDIENEA